MKWKKCTKCERYKTKKQFHKCKSSNDGLYSSCRDCVRNRMGNTKRIPRELYKNGILMRRCGKCKKYQKKTFFYFSECWRGGVSPNCKSCSIKEAGNELAKTKQKGKWQRVRMEVMIHYGGNPPKCACCGENQYEFLCIDHINNDGGKQRRLLGNGHMIYWIRKNYPKDLRILCHNCNMAKGFYGECPHKIKLSTT